MQLPQGGQEAQAAILDHADLVVAQAQPADGVMTVLRGGGGGGVGWGGESGGQKGGGRRTLGCSCGFPPVQLGVAQQVLQLDSLDFVVVQMELIQGLGEICRRGGLQVNSGAGGAWRARPLPSLAYLWGYQ